MKTYVFLAVIATLGTWLVTALGAAIVVFFKEPDKKLMNLMLGFASGVMIAASFWSLLAPAVKLAENFKTPAGIIVTTGFLSGALFIYFSDKLINAVKKDSLRDNGKSRIFMLIISITLHNIPEGLAVGVAFGALSEGFSQEALMGAIGVATGIGLQNFPEGAAVSLPLRREGYSRKKSFFLGQASGMVEPISGFLGATLVACVDKILPFALSFAAGAMILVAVHELIPECRENSRSSYFSTMGIISGFALMMLLDVML